MTPLSEGVSGFKNHVISYGQSLSVGVGTGSVISTIPAENALMFAGGVRAQDGAANPWDQHASLVPLVEAVGAADAGGTRYETPMSGFAEFAQEQQSQIQFLVSAPGKGESTLSQLSKPGALYNRLIDDVTYGHWRSNNRSKALAVLWLQGESDWANGSYAANLNTLRGTLNADIKAINGQPEDIWLLSYQLDRPKIGLAHLTASDTYSNIKVALPIYFLSRTDGVHFTAASSKIAGAYFGKAYKEVIVNGNTDWQPLRPVSHSTAGANCDVTFNPVGPLAFDTTIVAAQTNYGFKLYQSDGTTPITISSVALLNADTVRITASGSIPAGAILRYGFSDPVDHTANVSNGNLRDSQGNTIVFDGGGLNYPLHNWCVLFQRVIA